LRGEDSVIAGEKRKRSLRVKMVRNESHVELEGRGKGICPTRVTMDNEMSVKGREVQVTQALLSIKL